MSYIPRWRKQEAPRILDKFCIRTRFGHEPDFSNLAALDSTFDRVPEPQPGFSTSQDLCDVSIYFHMPTTHKSWQAREASSPLAYTPDLRCHPQSPVDPTTSATLTQSARKTVTSGIGTAPLRGEPPLLPSAEGRGDTVKPLMELPREDASHSLGVTPAEITSPLIHPPEEACSNPAKLLAEPGKNTSHSLRTTPAKTSAPLMSLSQAEAHLNTMKLLTERCEDASHLLGTTSVYVCFLLIVILSFPGP